MLVAACQTPEPIETGQESHLSTLKLAQPAQSFTVMSFNIRVGHGADDPGVGPYKLDWGRNLKAIAAAIRSVDPEIVGLQEVAGNGQVKRLARMLGMNHAYVPHPGGAARSEWWGVAILSKFPILEYRRHTISRGPGDAKSIVVAVLDTGIKRLAFVSIHKDKDLKDGSSVVNVLDAVKDIRMPVLIAGDFNIRSHDMRLNPLKRRFTDSMEGVDSAGAVIVRQAGTITSPRTHRPRRIDYIFADRKYFTVKDVGLVPQRHWSASDHRGYFAKLCFTPACR
ncbi:MAG: endonuclease/exonuclease/phosphatase family protein [Alphaproteobacteria bacterium]